MLNTNLTTEQETSLFNRLIKRFEPIDGFKREDYYGTLTMKFKKNNHYQIKLIYDYVDGRPKTSNSLTIPSKDNFLLALKVLEDRSLPERTITEVDDLFDFDVADSEPEVVVDSKPTKGSF